MDAAVINLILALAVTVTPLPTADQAAVKAVLGADYDSLKPAFEAGFLLTGELSPEAPVVAVAGRFQAYEPCRQTGEPLPTLTVDFMYEASNPLGTSIHGYSKLPIVVFAAGVMYPDGPKIADMVLRHALQAKSMGSTHNAVLDFILLGDGQVIGADPRGIYEKLKGRPAAVQSALAPGADLASIKANGGWAGWAASILLQARPEDIQSTRTRLSGVRGPILIPQRKKGQ